MTPSPAATEAATTAATIDPTLLALLPLIGVIATVIGGLIGAWIQGRREHRKWLRERRFEAFTAADVALTRIELLQSRARKYPQRAAEYLATVEEISLNVLPDVLSRLNMLGPNAVIAAKNAYQDASSTDDDEAIDVASTRFIQEMRKALGIAL